MAWNFFDLKTIFVNEIAGSALVFALLSLIFIFYVCAQFRVPNQIMMILAALWLILLGYYFASLQLFLVLGIVAGLVYFSWQMIKLLRG